MLHNLWNKLKPTSMKSSIDWFRENKCPICHHEGFYEGPSGGMSTNIQCANESCAKWFNLTVFPWGGIILEAIRGTILPEGKEARDGV